jgi:hypothetical protein
MAHIPLTPLPSWPCMGSPSDSLSCFHSPSFPVVPRCLADLVIDYEVPIPDPACPLQPSAHAAAASLADGDDEAPVLRIAPCSGFDSDDEVVFRMLCFLDPPPLPVQLFVMPCSLVANAVLGMVCVDLPPHFIFSFYFACESPSQRCRHQLYDQLCKHLYCRVLTTSAGPHIFSA